MILEIDIGNTLAKWRLRDKQQIIARGKTRSDDLSQSDLLTLRGIESVHLASVKASSVMDDVLLLLKDAFGKKVMCAETQSVQAGVTNSYANPSSMGIDRWLAMLAAYNHSGINYPPTRTPKRGCLVVSCGTAVTIDLVRADGFHEGGYILSGLMMMRDALLSRTGRIQYSPGRFEVAITPGNSTAVAVEHGAALAVLSAVEHVYADAVKRWGSVEFFLTGGDASELQGLLSMPCYLVEELVLDGLQYALPD